MVRKTYNSMVAELSGMVEEIFPWDLLDEMRTGLRGWNDDEQPLYNAAGALLDPDRVEVLFRSRVTVAQLGPPGVTARQAASA